MGKANSNGEKILQFPSKVQNLDQGVKDRMITPAIETLRLDS